MSRTTEIFFKTVRDHTSRRVVTVVSSVAMRDVVGLMATEKHSAVIIVDNGQRPLGIITEQDIVRRAAFNADPDQPAADLMTSPVHTIGDDERLFIAIARMRRLGHRHLPVVDAEGRVAGMLDLHETMIDAAGDLVERIDELSQDDTIDGLRDVKAAQVDTVEHLLADGVAAAEIQTLLSHVNKDIYRRLLERNISVLASEGRGAPPVPFCLIIMGSGGRSENHLNPDQDYGFVLEDYADERHNDIDPWFIELGSRLSDDLDAVGLPYCTGNVMATNPLWRKSVSQWKGQVDYWNRRCFTTALLHFDIFFDFSGAWGDRALAQEVRGHVTNVLRGNEPFLRALYTADRDHGTARRWFGRFATEQKDETQLGKVNLKLYGLLPLTEGVRILALREGVDDVPTLSRLAALNQRGVINDDDAEDIRAAHGLLFELLLRSQVKDVNDGLGASSFVHPNSLSRRDKRRLREAFKSIEGLRTRINFEFGGEIF